MFKDTNAGRNGHFFFIADEPSKKLVENHKLWLAVRDTKVLDLVPANEIEKIESYMHQHGVFPLFAADSVGK